MKKKLLVIALASLLSAPSIVFAEATWYGSFRAGAVSDNGDTALRSHNSRWGVRGSNEISDGLMAVYRYEEHLNLTNATLLEGNRLSFVGLSGGFGTVTMGRIWGAEYNTTGVILDNSYFHGNSYGSYRISNALSYAVETGPVSMQLDTVMARASNPVEGVNTRNTKTLDQYLFGLSAGFGSGKVAVSYRANSTVPETKDTNLTLAGEYTFGATRVYLGYSRRKEPNDHDTETMGIQDRRTTNISAGVGGSFGDNGLSYLLQVTQREQKTGGAEVADTKQTPVLLTLAYSLGGSSTIILEGITNRKVVTEDGQGAFTAEKRRATVGLYLKVDF